LPTIWFRNTWSWGRDPRKPSLREGTPAMIEASHDGLGSYEFHCENVREFLFTENESNLERLWGVPNRCPFVKDSINNAVIQNRVDIANPDKTGTKAAAHYRFTIPANESRTVRLRFARVDLGSARNATPARSSRAVRGASPRTSLSQNPVGEAPTGAREARALPGEELRDDAFSNFDEIFAARKAEADEFYDAIAPVNLGSEFRAIQRQALAGLLWTKQFYYYVVEEWLAGDPAHPPPPES